MIDSCNDSNVEPGLAARYSTFRLLRTSTMKSDPGRSITRTVAAGPAPPFSRASRCAGGVAAPDPEATPRAGGSSCDFPIWGCATRAAAPAAAPFRNPRRANELVFLVDLG